MLYAAFGRLLVKSDGVPYHINDADLIGFCDIRRPHSFSLCKEANMKLINNWNNVEAKRPNEPVLNVHEIS